MLAAAILSWSHGYPSLYIISPIRFSIAGSWYGLVRDPVDMGSGGGGAEGGAGGAYLYLKVYETLTLEGHIKVDGQTGQGKLFLK